MPDIRFLFQNLFINKYEIKSAKRLGKDMLHVTASKKDEFGYENTYNFLFLSTNVTEAQIIGLKKRTVGKSIAIGSLSGFGIDYTEEEFYDKFQTTINHGIYLNPNLQTLLSDLGHNQLPSGLSGKADDLFEEYTKECLQFLLGGIGRRYGRERSFEKLPDGAILGRDTTILFDAKAYSGGYNPSADDIKRFSNYVLEFNQKYAKYGDKVYAFIVLSGHFDVGHKALNDRSDEMYEKCQTKLVFINSENLADIVKLSIEHLGLLLSVNWKRILNKAVPTKNLLQDQFTAIQKDKII